MAKIIHPRASEKTMEKTIPQMPKNGNRPKNRAILIAGITVLAIYNSFFLACAVRAKEKSDLDWKSIVSDKTCV